MSKPRTGARRLLGLARISPCTRPPVLTFTVVLALSATILPAAAATTPRTTLPVIERQVMCVTCKIPLNVAESPQADRERALIRRLIAEGKTEAQVKSALVGQYGAAVLGLPVAKGFDLTAYVVPIAVVLAVLALLALLLPNWRRRARGRTTVKPSTPELSASDAARLDADLRRFD